MAVTGALVAVVVLGLGVMVHSMYAVASARRAPAPFADAAHTTTPDVAGPRPSASLPPATIHTRSRGVHAGTAAFVPTELYVAGLRIDAPVVQVLSDQRTLTPPDDPSHVGWWIASAPAGSASGSIVIVGHIDSAASGPGALFNLDRIKAGQTIALSNASTTTRYRATSLQYYRKSEGLPATLFNPSGPARLVLITCGGTFDAAKRSYRSNVVVIATPA